jgi:F-type H+-transporting ATPase subunit b
MATPTAATEVPAGHNSFPPFQTENFPSQLVWLALTFVLLYVIMSKVALPRIGSILQVRAKHIADDLAAANSYKDKSDAAHTAYEKALADARSRAQGIAGATREKQAQEAEELQQRLEAQLHERLTAAEKSIAQTRASAMGNVHSIAADTAASIVQRLIGQVPADADIAGAVSDVIKR